MRRKSEAELHIYGRVIVQVLLVIDGGGENSKRKLRIRFLLVLEGLDKK